MTRTVLNSNHTTTKTNIKLPDDFQYHEKAPSSSNNPYAKFYYQGKSSDTLMDVDDKKRMQ